MEFIINVAADSGQGTPSFTGVFNRINIILGANGSGKTRLLRHLASASEHIFGEQYSPVTIEGGRTLNIPINVGMQQQNISLFSQPLAGRAHYKGSRRDTLAGRIHQTFVILKALEASERSNHSDLCEEWRLTGRLGDAPARLALPFEKLIRLFHEIFPHMEIEVTQHNQIYVRKDNAYYSADSMSDGEKQVLMLLADIAVLTNERSVFFIDEPELNLHPSLAEKLWNSLEETYPNDIFIYSTHNLAFAMRDNVDAIFAMGYGAIDTANLSDHGIDIKPFLGSIPSIVRFGKCLFVEGEETSFDYSFYGWALKNSSIGIFPLGASTNVTTASSREGIWSRLATGITIGGVIDKDYKTTSEIPSNVVLMGLHEAESYLCHPSIVVGLQNKLANSDRALTEAMVVDALIKVAQERLLYVVAQRVFTRTYVNLQISLQRNILSNITRLEDLKASILTSATEVGVVANAAFDHSTLEALVESEYNNCQKIITDRDVDKLLEVFEGKKFLAAVFGMAGCPSPSGMLKAVIKHYTPDEIPHLSALNSKIQEILQIT